MKKPRLSGAVSVCLLIYACASHSALVTTNTIAVTDNFSNFSGGFNSGAGPVTLASGAVWSTTSTSSVIGDGLYLLGDNGAWGAARLGFTGLNIDNGSMTFDLPSLADYVGGFINYDPNPSYPDVIIEALDASGNVLETYNINQEAPIETSVSNNGAFRGISRASADIAALRLSNSLVVLDDLTFASTIPIPAAFWLFGSGLLGLVGIARRKKAG